MRVVGYLIANSTRRCSYYIST